MKVVNQDRHSAEEEVKNSSIVPRDMKNGLGWAGEHAMVKKYLCNVLHVWDKAETTTISKLGTMKHILSSCLRPVGERCYRWWYDEGFFFFKKISY